MFSAKNMVKKTNKFNKKYQKWVLKEIKHYICDAANKGDNRVGINKSNSAIDENLADEIVKYFNQRGFKAENHEGYNYIDISWGE